MHFDDFAVYLKHINASTLSALFICIWQKMWRWSLCGNVHFLSVLAGIVILWTCTRNYSVSQTMPALAHFRVLVPRRLFTGNSSYLDCLDKLAPDCWALSCWNTLAREIKDVNICTLKVILPCKCARKKNQICIWYQLNCVLFTRSTTYGSHISF